MKRCLAQLVNTETQIKTTLTNHYKPVTAAKIKNSDIIKYWQGFKKLITHTLLVGMVNGIATLELSLVVSQKTK